ncbi:hypothetical protein AJ80_00621 [Polytolypa hystricis UAMH7299]|uniref:Uncharacterized protein n=1 Tax=Polytolypa hystricis (strain UAMH7299) TaxID=1447883 RepID=A0A2B7Z3A6_POLH7|nr:hypothetical protein AJ80_00621 [Polytolypa hystricis UAMH7299]
MSTSNFPARTQSFTAATTTTRWHEDVKISGPTPFRTRSRDSLTAIPSTEAPFNSPPRNASSPQPTAATAVGSSPSSPATARRTTYHNPLNASSHAPQDSISSYVSRDSTMHRRRGSTLKTVMRKLFGRKRRSQPDEPDSAYLDEQRGSANASPWTPNGPDSPENPFVTVPDSVRSQAPSIPNQDVVLSKASRGNSLRTTSELKFPSTLDENPSLMPAVQQARRRATLPSIILPPEEAGELAAKITQSPTRPSSIRSSSEPRESFGELPRRSSRQYKRRSRSASALREAAITHRMSPIQWRRRSDEIKFWRTSVLKSNGSPSISTRPETATTVDSVVHGLEESQVDPAVRNSNNTVGPELSPRPFHFSTLMGTMGDGGETSLAQRVATLEVKLMDLEFAIAKLQGQGISPIRPTPFERASRQPSPHTKDHEPSNSSGRDPSTFIGSADSSTDSNPSQASHAGDHRTSVTTIRPRASSQQLSSLQPSSVSDFTGISVDQYSALTTLVRREQTARKQLEEQLLELQRDIAQMRHAYRISMQGSFLLPGSDSASFHRTVRPMFSSPSINMDSRAADGGMDMDRESSYLDSYYTRTEDVYGRPNIEAPARKQIVGMI